MVDLAETIFRDFETDGVPASGLHKPRKSKIREWGAYLEGFITAFTSNGGLIYDTRANLFADLAHDANTSAWVISDPTVGYNGIYRKIGASGAGSWTRVADLPYSFIRLNDAGAGTANAIIATSSIPLPGAASAALLVMNVFEANTGPVTITANGAAAKPLKTNSGNDLAASYLTAGMMISFIDDGTNFRLLSDVASAAIVAAADAARIAAEAAVASVNLPIIAPGDAGKQLYVTEDEDGYVLRPPSSGALNVLDFGAVGDGVTDDTDAIQAAIDAAASGARILFPTAHYYLTNLQSDKTLTLDFMGSDLTVAPGVADLSSAVPALEFTGELVLPRNDIVTVTDEHAESVTLVSGTASALFSAGDYVELLDVTPTKGWDEETITAVSITAGGSGYTNGQFAELVATSGVGTNAAATLTVVAGAVTAVTLVSGGTGWQVGNTFNIVPSVAGGAGATGQVSTIGGGASVTYSGRKEVNRVKGTSGGTIFLEKSVEWLYDSAYDATITKINVLHRPQILNVGTIREVDPGSYYTGSTIGGPHIFRFFGCVDPLVSRATVDGWQMDVCQFSMCVNPIIEQVTAQNPFRPVNAGHGYMVQFERSTGGLARNNVAHAVRHMVDFTQAYDCVSQGNKAFAPYGTQFTGHGQGAKRCKSIDDTLYLGGGERPLGWSWGNPSFAADYDYTIIRPTVVGWTDGEYAAILFHSTTGSRGMKVIDPLVRAASPTNYVKAVLATGGAEDTSLIGGDIDLSGALVSTGSSVVRSESGVGGSTAVLRPRNLTIKGTKMSGAAVALSSAVWTLQLGGYLRIEDIEITSNEDQHGIRVGTTPLQEIQIENTRHFNGGRRAITIEAAPTERYIVKDTYGKGTFTSGKESLAASSLLTQGYSAGYLVGSATYDAASLADGAGVTTTVTVTGAKLGDPVSIGHSVSVAGMTVTAWVSATNTVSVRFQNESGGVLDLASGTLKAMVWSVAA